MSPQVMLSLLLLMPMTIPAQSNQTDIAPKELLTRATDKNGVDFSPNASWHIKLSYDQFDEDGDKIHSGTFEEYYGGTKKYKQTYVADNFNQTIVATTSGLYRSGDLRWVSPIELQIQTEVLTPLYRSGIHRENTRLDSLEWPLGAVTLPCVVIRRTDMTISDNGLPKYCFDRNTPRLRYTRGKGWDATIYNNVVLFQNRFVARDVLISKGGKSQIKIHVDTLEALQTEDDAAFRPTPSSALLTDPIVVPSAILDDMVITKGDLIRGSGTGTVRIRFVIGKDGHVKEASAIEGPTGLKKEAERTMRSYIFHPFLVLGEPFEVSSEMLFSYF